MRYLTILYWAWLMALPFTLPAEDDEPELPRQVIQALDQYDKHVSAAQQTFRNEVEEARADAIKRIEYQMERATKKGDLELALAIKAKLEELQAHMPGGLQELDMLGNAEENTFDPKGTWLLTNLSKNTENKFVFSDNNADTLWSFSKEDGLKVLRPSGNYFLFDEPVDLDNLKGWYIANGRKRDRATLQRITE